MTKRERLYPEIKRLREDGVVFREIGQRFGLATSTVFDYFSDPTGNAAKARKVASDASLKRQCPKCDGPMGPARSGSQTCHPCYAREVRAGHQCRIEDVAEMYRSGMSQRAIARELGYGENSVPPEISIARRMGLIGYRYKAYEQKAAA